MFGFSRPPDEQQLPTIGRLSIGIKRSGINRSWPRPCTRPPDDLPTGHAPEEVHERAPKGRAHGDVRLDVGALPRQAHVVQEGQGHDPALNVCVCVCV